MWSRERVQKQDWFCINGRKVACFCIVAASSHKSNFTKPRTSFLGPSLCNFKDYPTRARWMSGCEERKRWESWLCTASSRTASALPKSIFALRPLSYMKAGHTALHIPFYVLGDLRYIKFKREPFTEMMLKCTRKDADWVRNVTAESLI